VTGPRLLDGPIRALGVVARREASDLADVTERLVRFADDRGLELFPESEHCKGPLEGRTPLADALGRIDLLVTLGGDGTLLRGVREVMGRGVPTVGVNLGRLGFLTSVPAEELEQALDLVLGGEAYLDPRFSLEARVVRSDGSSGEELWALNDVVLHKRGVARVVGLELEVEENGETEAIGSFTGDGVIVATPTGSTAYSLSAGGPVIAPTTGCIIITPISPHTMAMRPLVLPDHVRLSIRAVDRAEDLVLTADGQVAVDLGPGDSVQVRKGAHRIDLVRLPGQTFFDTLRHKLNWAV
jgi:NAD+ kinase